MQDEQTLITHQKNKVRILQESLSQPSVGWWPGWSALSCLVQKCNQRGLPTPHHPFPASVQHFKCEVCNRKLTTAKALAVHSLQVHKVTVHK